MMLRWLPSVDSCGRVRNGGAYRFSRVRHPYPIAAAKFDNRFRRFVGRQSFKNETYIVAPSQSKTLWDPCDS
jgi:hypothetical protein